MQTISYQQKVKEAQRRREERVAKICKGISEKSSSLSRSTKCLHIVRSKAERGAVEETPLSLFSSSATPGHFASYSSSSASSPLRSPPPRAPGAMSSLSPRCNLRQAGGEGPPRDGLSSLVPFRNSKSRSRKSPHSSPFGYLLSTAASRNQRSSSRRNIEEEHDHNLRSSIPRYTKRCHRTSVSLPVHRNEERSSTRRSERNEGRCSSCRRRRSLHRREEEERKKNEVEKERRRAQDLEEKNWSTSPQRVSPLRRLFSPSIPCSSSLLSPPFSSICIQRATASSSSRMTSGKSSSRSSFTNRKKEKKKPLASLRSSSSCCRVSRSLQTEDILREEEREQEKRRSEKSITKVSCDVGGSAGHRRRNSNSTRIKRGTREDPSCTTLAASQFLSGFPSSGRRCPSFTRIARNLSGSGSFSRKSNSLSSSPPPHTPPPSLPPAAIVSGGSRSRSFSVPILLSCMSPPRRAMEGNIGKPKKNSTSLLAAAATSPSASCLPEKDCRESTHHHGLLQNLSTRHEAEDEQEKSSSLIKLEAKKRSRSISVLVPSEEEKTEESYHHYDHHVNNLSSDKNKILLSPKPLASPLPSSSSLSLPLSSGLCEAPFPSLPISSTTHFYSNPPPCTDVFSLPSPTHISFSHPSCSSSSAAVKHPPPPPLSTTTTTTTFPFSSPLLREVEKEVAEGGIEEKPIPQTDALFTYRNSSGSSTDCNTCEETIFLKKLEEGGMVEMKEINRRRAHASLRLSRVVEGAKEKEESEKAIQDERNEVQTITTTTSIPSSPSITTAESADPDFRDEAAALFPLPKTSVPLFSPPPSVLLPKELSGTSSSTSSSPLRRTLSFFSFSSAQAEQQEAPLLPPPDLTISTATCPTIVTTSACSPRGRESSPRAARLPPPPPLSSPSPGHHLPKASYRDDDGGIREEDCCPLHLTTSGCSPISISSEVVKASRTGTVEEKRHPVPSPSDSNFEDKSHEEEVNRENESIFSQIAKTQGKSHSCPLPSSSFSYFHEYCAQISPFSSSCPPPSRLASPPPPLSSLSSSRSVSVLASTDNSGVGSCGACQASSSPSPTIFFNTCTSQLSSTGSATGSPPSFSSSSIRYSGAVRAPPCTPVHPLWEEEEGKDNQEQVNYQQQQQDITTNHTLIQTAEAMENIVKDEDAGVEKVKQQPPSPSQDHLRKSFGTQQSNMIQLHLDQTIFPSEEKNEYERSFLLSPPLGHNEANHHRDRLSRVGVGVVDPLIEEMTLVRPPPISFSSLLPCDMPVNAPCREKTSMNRNNSGTAAVPASPFPSPLHLSPAVVPSSQHEKVETEKEKQHQHSHEPEEEEEEPQVLSSACQPLLRQAHLRKRGRSESRESMEEEPYGRGEVVGLIYCLHPEEGGSRWDSQEENTVRIGMQRREHKEEGEEKSECLGDVSSSDGAHLPPHARHLEEGPAPPFPPGHSTQGPRGSLLVQPTALRLSSSLSSSSPPSGSSASTMRSSSPSLTEEHFLHSTPLCVIGLGHTESRSECPPSPTQLPSLEMRPPSPPQATGGATAQKEEEISTSISGVATTMIVRKVESDALEGMEEADSLWLEKNEGRRSALVLLSSSSSSSPSPSLLPLSISSLTSPPSPLFRTATFGWDRRPMEEKEGREDNRRPRSRGSWTTAVCSHSLASVTEDPLMEKQKEEHAEEPKEENAKEDGEAKRYQQEKEEMWRRVGRGTAISPATAFASMREAVIDPLPVQSSLVGEVFPPSPLSPPLSSTRSLHCDSIRRMGTPPLAENNTAKKEEEGWPPSSSEVGILFHTNSSSPTRVNCSAKSVGKKMTTMTATDETELDAPRSGDTMKTDHPLALPLSRKNKSIQNENEQYQEEKHPLHYPNGQSSHPPAVDIAGCSEDCFFSSPSVAMGGGTTESHDGSPSLSSSSTSNHRANEEENDNVKVVVEEDDDDEEASYLPPAFYETQKEISRLSCRLDSRCNSPLPFPLHLPSSPSLSTFSLFSSYSGLPPRHNNTTTTTTTNKNNGGGGCSRGQQEWRRETQHNEEEERRLALPLRLNSTHRKEVTFILEEEEEEEGIGFPHAHRVAAVNTSLSPPPRRSGLLCDESFYGEEEGDEKEEGNNNNNNSSSHTALFALTEEVKKSLADFHTAHQEKPLHLSVFKRRNKSEREEYDDDDNVLQKKKRARKEEDEKVACGLPIELEKEEEKVSQKESKTRKEDDKKEEELCVDCRCKEGRRAISMTRREGWDSHPPSPLYPTRESMDIVTPPPILLPSSSTASALGLASRTDEPRPARGDTVSQLHTTVKAPDEEDLEEMMKEGGWRPEVLSRKDFFAVPTRSILTYPHEDVREETTAPLLPPSVPSPRATCVPATTINSTIPTTTMVLATAPTLVDEGCQTSLSLVLSLLPPSPLPAAAVRGWSLPTSPPAPSPIPAKTLPSSFFPPSTTTDTSSTRRMDVHCEAGEGAAERSGAPTPALSSLELRSTYPTMNEEVQRMRHNSHEGTEDEEHEGDGLCREGAPGAAARSKRSRPRAPRPPRIPVELCASNEVDESTCHHPVSTCIVCLAERKQEKVEDEQALKREGRIEEITEKTKIMEKEEGEEVTFAEKELKEIVMTKKTENQMEIAEEAECKFPAEEKEVKETIRTRMMLKEEEEGGVVGEEEDGEKRKRESSPLMLAEGPDDDSAALNALAISPSFSFVLRLSSRSPSQRGTEYQPPSFTVSPRPLSLSPVSHHCFDHPPHCHHPHDPFSSSSSCTTTPNPHLLSFGEDCSVLPRKAVRLPADEVEEEQIGKKESDDEKSEENYSTEDIKEINNSSSNTVEEEHEKKYRGHIIPLSSVEEPFSPSFLFCSRTEGQDENEGFFNDIHDGVEMENKEKDVEEEETERVEVGEKVNGSTVEESEGNKIDEVKDAEDAEEELINFSEDDEDEDEDVEKEEEKWMENKEEEMMMVVGKEESIQAIPLLPQDSISWTSRHIPSTEVVWGTTRQREKWRQKGGKKASVSTKKKNCVRTRVQGLQVKKGKKQPKRT